MMGAVTNAVPISCLESQRQRGKVQEDGITVLGESGFRVDLQYDLFSEGSADAVRIAESCEGINQIRATKVD